MHLQVYCRALAAKNAMPQLCVQLVPMATSQLLSSHRQIFDAAVDIIQSLPKKGPVKVSTDQRLQFYSFFKQGTIGECNVPRPSFWNVVEVFKWDAWSKLGSLPHEEAQQEYITSFRKFVDDIQAQFNCVPWLKANDEFCETVLRPKFEVLGYDWKVVDMDGEEKLVDMADVRNGTHNKQSAATSETISEGKEECQRVADDEISSSGDMHTAGVCSSDDEDYTDAHDTHEHFRLLPATDVGNDSRSVSCSSTNSTTPPTGMVMQTQTAQSSEVTVEVTQLQLSTLTSHLRSLLKLITSQQHIISSTVKNLTPRVEGIFLSWRTLIFLLIWPLLVNIIIKFSKFWIKS